MTKQELTKTALQRLIRWSPSRTNELRKEEVVNQAYNILLKGEEVAVFGSGTYAPTTGWAYPAYLIDGPGRSIAIHETGGIHLSQDDFAGCPRVEFDVDPELWQKRRADIERLEAHALQAAHAWSIDEWGAARSRRLQSSMKMPGEFAALFAEAPATPRLGKKERREIWWQQCRREGLTGVAMRERAEREARETQAPPTASAPRAEGCMAAVIQMAAENTEKTNA